VLGWTTHVLGAGRGVNAIEKSWILITALRELEEELNRPERLERGYEHAVHPLNLNVGTIRGGDWASTVPGECVTRFRMGLMPGHRCRELMTTIEQRVAQAAQSDPWLAEFPPRVEYVGFQAEGCTFDTDSALAQALTRAHQRWRSTAPDPLSATCTTDVRFFNLYYGVPATCYGPEAENIHGADERVSIDSMRRVAEVVTGLLIDWCGVRRHS
jgi:acetylornithine deacetylase